MTGERGPGERAGLATPEAPEALVVGHLTRDLAPGGWRLGGAALYAARTARLRGLRVAVVTSASDDVVEAARAALPGVVFHVIPSPVSTTFENHYHAGARTQRLHAVAKSLRVRDVPAAWLDTPIVLLAPVAREVDPAIARALRATTLGLTPQGWLRAWGADGAVRPAPLEAAALDALAVCDVVIVSRDDLAGPGLSPGALEQAEATLREWAKRVACLAVTRGREGAELWRGERVDLIAGLPIRELDPTGAGDVFAMALLCALAAGAAPERAVSEANQVAAMSVEGVGASAIPTPDAARDRFGA